MAISPDILRALVQPGAARYGWGDAMKDSREGIQANEEHRSVLKHRQEQIANEQARIEQQKARLAQEGELAIMREEGLGDRHESTQALTREQAEAMITPAVLG